MIIKKSLARIKKTQNLLSNLNSPKSDRALSDKTKVYENVNRKSLQVKEKTNDLLCVTLSSSRSRAVKTDSFRRTKAAVGKPLYKRLWTKIQ